MKGYLGEFDVTDQHEISTTEAIMIYIESYGQIDGDHHKQWLIDQIVRLVKGGKLIINEARWENGYKELRFSIIETDEYHQWVKDYMNGEDGPETYEYDKGTPP